MKLHKTTEIRGWGKLKPLLSLFAAVAAVLASNAASPEYTIHAPNGIGDVITLTNVLATMETDGASVGLKLWLEPGVYDLRGIKMETGSHLVVRHTRDSLIAGLGAKPGDTILLGGGETDKCRVAYVTGGGNYWTTTISNLTVTGGYADNAAGSRNGCGGGICAGNTSVLYDTCIFSNNVAVVDATSNSTKNYGGGGCYYGRARNCLFAGNSTTGAGGGISTAHRNGSNQTYTPANIEDCVFTNNHNTASCYTITWEGEEHCGGGGAACVPKGALVARTQFIDNSAVTRGGALLFTGGGGAVSDCIFVKNSTSDKAGGALYGGGVAVTNCTFAGNVSPGSGAGIYFTSSPATGCVVRCRFYGNMVTNWNHGAAICTKDAMPHAQVFDSDFAGNSSAGYGHAACRADLFDCIVTNHVAGNHVLYECNLTRCVVGYNTLSGNAACIDYSATVGAYTNINCLVISNSHTAIGHVSMNKVNINCTYLGNKISNSNYGDIIRECPSFNCIFSGNRIGSYYKDIRTSYLGGETHAVALTNCVFNVADVAVDSEGLHNCKMVTDMKFADAAHGDYTPKVRSAAYNAGCNEPWLLGLVGAKDLAGNRRVFDAGIDAGAYECQQHLPGIVVSFK